LQKVCEELNLDLPPPATEDDDLDWIMALAKSDCTEQEERASEEPHNGAQEDRHSEPDSSPSLQGSHCTNTPHEDCDKRDPASLRNRIMPLRGRGSKGCGWGLPTTSQHPPSGAEPLICKRKKKKPKGGGYHGHKTKGG